MTPEVASLIVRQAIALSREGIGPRAFSDGVNPAAADRVVLAEAVEAISPWMTAVRMHDMWDAGLVSDEKHPPCRFCSYRSKV